MLKIFTNPLTLAAGGIIVAGVILSSVYFYGKSVGRADLVQKMQADRIQILKDGKKVDEEVFSSDDAALCSILGGCLPVDAEPD